MKRKYHVKIRFYKHRSLTLTPAPDIVWMKRLGLSYTSILDRIRKGELIRDNCESKEYPNTIWEKLTYERVFNCGAVENLLESLVIGGLKNKLKSKSITNSPPVMSGE